MKKLILILFFAFSVILPANSNKYNLYNPNNYKYDTDSKEKLLFIIDMSNSMNERLENDTKFNLMKNAFYKILPSISADTDVGLRIYGHKMGFTPIEACRASILAAPIAKNNVQNIQSVFQKRKPRGMTPITYSLKQAIKYDFMGFTGKKHIILLTDGGENCDESPCTFVMNLIKIRRDIQIDVIAFNIKDEDDLEQLKCTAFVTSGKFYNPQTSAQLVDSFSKGIEEVKNVEAKIILNNFEK